MFELSSSRCFHLIIELGEGTIETEDCLKIGKYLLLQSAILVSQPLQFLALVFVDYSYMKKKFFLMIY